MNEDWKGKTGKYWFFRLLHYRSLESASYIVASFYHISVFMELKSVSLCAPERIMKKYVRLLFEAKGPIQGCGKLKTLEWKPILVPLDACRISQRYQLRLIERGTKPELKLVQSVGSAVVRSGCCSDELFGGHSIRGNSVASGWAGGWLLRVGEFSCKSSGRRRYRLPDSSVKTYRAV
jgi:hypothetical protein